MSELEAGAAAPEGNALASTPEVTQVQIVETPQPSVEDTMGAIYDKHHPEARVGRENGKFVSKDKAEGAEPAEPAEITQEPIKEEPEPAKPVIEFPKAWAADRQKIWDTLSPEAKEYIARRESDAQKGHSQLGEKASRADRYESVINRYKHVLNDAPDKEIESLLATKEAFLRDKQGTFERLAQQLGIDLSQYARTSSENAPAETDQIRSLMQEVQGLKRQLGETTNRLTAREQQEQKAQEQSLAKLVEDHSKGKDYWAEIEPEVLKQIYAIQMVNPNRNPKEILDEAEKNALKLNDEVSNRLNKAKRDKEAADKAATDKRKADEAKRLASINTKSSSGSTPKAAFTTMAEEMANIYDKVAARG